MISYHRMALLSVLKNTPVHNNHQHKWELFHFQNQLHFLLRNEKQQTLQKQRLHCAKKRAVLSPNSDQYEHPGQFCWWRVSAGNTWNSEKESDLQKRFCDISSAAETKQSHYLQVCAADRTHRGTAHLFTSCLLAYCFTLPLCQQFISTQEVPHTTSRQAKIAG